MAGATPVRCPAPCCSPNTPTRRHAPPLRSPVSCPVQRPHFGLPACLPACPGKPLRDLLCVVVCVRVPPWSCVLACSCSPACVVRGSGREAEASLLAVPGRSWGFISLFVCVLVCVCAWPHPGHPCWAGVPPSRQNLGEGGAVQVRRPAVPVRLQQLPRGHQSPPAGPWVSVITPTHTPHMCVCGGGSLGAHSAFSRACARRCMQCATLAHVPIACWEAVKGLRQPSRPIDHTRTPTTRGWCSVSFACGPDKGGLGWRLGSGWAGGPCWGSGLTWSRVF